MAGNNPTTVELDVRDSHTNDPGWNNVTGSNHAPYSYKYTGGNTHDNNGNVKYHKGDGQAAITLRLVADPRYQFIGDCIHFVNDPTGQLSTSGNAPRLRVVNDKCTETLDAQYKVLVTDTGVTPNATIQCDPRVVNDIPPL